MKKILVLLSIIVFFFGCKNQQESATEIKVGATPVPHAQILEFIKPLLEKEGFSLKIIPYTDYVTPNLALQDNLIDANFFQHLPYLEKSNQDRNLTLVSAGLVHIEPLSIYSKKIQQLKSLKEGDIIAIPNDPSNLARALILLDNQKIIKLRDSKNLSSTEQDIIQNPKKLVIKPMEAGLLPKILDDVALAVINGNYALQAKLKNPISQEGKESPYANIIAVKKGKEDSAKIKALMRAIQSDSTRDFILQNYNGEIIPAF
ncbi:MULTISPECIES: MetQ/NlpA family ABC transporter substrate-binding protein [unclassified Helicobacter]|uniref:MetQ/NlpA family ABC transporter substrate-binding protein n=1 Tax=unclassified Helicobacter TaxID=2593540 RepID=UPI000CF1315F|nr:MULTISPECIES: MetQ/NlpA family ABC transporter substrate-binding protein [unclassified Helicobacter]